MFPPRPSRRSPGRRSDGPGQGPVKPESAGFGPIPGKTRGFLADTNYLSVFAGLAPAPPAGQKTGRRRVFVRASLTLEPVARDASPRKPGICRRGARGLSGSGGAIPVLDASRVDGHGGRRAFGTRGVAPPAPSALLSCVAATGDRRSPRSSPTGCRWRRRSAPANAPRTVGRSPAGSRDMLGGPLRRRAWKRFRTVEYNGYRWVTPATGNRWKVCTGHRRTPTGGSPAGPPHLSPLRRHRLHDGSFIVRQIVLTAVFRTTVQLPGGPVPGHGSLRIRLVKATKSGESHALEQDHPTAP